MATTNIGQSYFNEDVPLPEGAEDRDRRLRHRLELQTNQIEQIFAQNQIPVRVSGGTVRSKSYGFELRPHLHEGWDRLKNIKGDLINALGASEVQLKRKNGRVRLSIRKSHPHAVDLLDLHANAQPDEGIAVILGLDDEGKMICLDLADEKLSNILITGNNAAGKSGLMRTIAVSLALANRQAQVQLGIIAAPSKHAGFIARPDLIYPLTHLPHALFPVVSSPEEALEALQFLTDEVTYREETGLDWPLLVVLIDNADVLLSTGDYAISSLFARLAGASPAAGLRLILSAANPNDGELGRILKHNVSLRFNGRSAKPRGQTRADDASYLNGQGDFLADSYGTVTRFQAAYIDDYDLHLTLGYLHRRQNIVLLAQTQDDGSGGLVEDELGHERPFVYDSANGEVTLDRGPSEYHNGENIVDGRISPRESSAIVDPTDQPAATEDTEDNLGDTEPEFGDVIHLNAIGSSEEVSLVRSRPEEVEYSDFNDEWRETGDGEINHTSRHIH